MPSAFHPQLLTPPGPQDEYRNTEDLLNWMDHQFGTFGDIYKARMFGGSVYAIRSIEFAYHVLVENWQNYVKGQFIKRVAFLLGNGLMVSEGELWKRQRRLIQPAFDHRSIGGLVNMIAAVNRALLEKWKQAARQNTSVNLTRDVSGMALEVVLRFIFGEDYEKVAGPFNLLSEESARDLAFAEAFRALGRIVREIASQRRNRPSGLSDALGVIIGARDSNNGQFMNDAQLINEILTLVVAGHETTASTLNWMWYLISQHPKVEARLATELTGFMELASLEDLARFPYARQVVEETMRLYPAGWLMTRKAIRDDRLGPYFVPAGTEIYVAPYFIQRHPAVWEQPDKFDPDRFSVENSKGRHRLANMPFSAGPRNCIGASLARAEMQIHLLILASHLRLRYLQSKPIELDAGVNLRNKYDFVMSPELKVNAS